MKISVSPEKGTITSVAVGIGPQRLSVLVNTRDRWIEFHRQGGSETVSEDDATGLVPIHQHFVFHVEGSTTLLTLVAETPEEVQYLKWPCFTLQEKDQIHLMFLPYQELPQVTYWRPDESPGVERVKSLVI